MKKILSLFCLYIYLYLAVYITMFLYGISLWYFYMRHSEMLEGVLFFLPLELFMILFPMFFSFFFTWLFHKKRKNYINQKEIFWISYVVIVLFSILMWEFNTLWNFPLQRSWFGDNEFISLFLNLTIFYSLSIEGYLWVKGRLKQNPGSRTRV